MIWRALLFWLLSTRLVSANLPRHVGPFGTDGISNTYSQGHRISTSITSAVSTLNFAYGYDLGWRMQTVTSPSGIFGYNYPNSASSLILGIALPNFAYITNNYDALARQTGTALMNHWGHVLDGYDYLPDALGLRKSITRNFGITTNTVSIDYDNIGQLTSWLAIEGTNGAARENEQFGLGFDAADNLHLRTNGAMVQTFTVNNLNELSSVGRSGNFTFIGSTPAPTTNLTVNGNSAATYGDFTFAVTGLSLANGANTFTTIAKGVAGAATNVLIENLPTNVAQSYDLSGNVIFDGSRYFLLDAENRVTNVYATNLWMVQFAYDGLSRRRIMRQFTWSSGAWSKTNEVDYLYDGFVIIQERNTNGIPLVTYTRGLDYSGTLNGAGGIGGLLARTDANGSTFLHSDGAGNITALMDASNNIVARYLYGPFGKLIGQWGKLAVVNTMQFSSMPSDNVSGLSAFSLRFYDANFQRWINPDPIDETGGINLYGFAGNSPLNAVDPLGLADYFYSAGSLLQPSGPVPYLEAESTIGNIATSIYNTIPVVYNGLFGWASDIGKDEGTASATGNNYAMAAAIGTDALNLIPGLGEDANAANSLLSKCKAAILKANKLKGAEFENATKQMLNTTDKNVVEQVTVQTSSGTKTRLDFVSFDPQTGQLNLTEAKGSATAPFTPNQSVAFPEIQQTGATVVGNGKPGVPGGTQIPPTVVNVVRPNH